MKKSILSLTLILLILCLTFSAFAAFPVSRLVDDADLLNGQEEQYLVNRLNEISDHYDLDVVIVTVNSLNGATAESYADDYYDYNGYRPDGVLLLISMQERQWAISTTGYGITAFTDAGLAYLEEQFIDDLSAGNYADAFLAFASESENMIIQAQSGRPYDVGNMPKAPFQPLKSLMISLVIGIVAALIITGIMKSQLKSVRSQAAAAQYVKEGSMELTLCRDIYLYRNITRQKRDSGSSGGSSTHRGSSGTSHGGRSGGF